MFRIICFLLVACAGCFASEPWLFFHSFDHGPAADFAAGSPETVSLGRGSFDQPGKSGTALSIPLEDHICFDLDGNLSMAEGAIEFDVCLRFNPPELREGYGRTQCLLSSEIRSRQKIQLKIRQMGRKTFLVLETADGNDPTRAGIDISHWKAGEWHAVRAAWNRAERLIELGTDGKTETTRNAAVPGCEAPMMYEMYIGTDSDSVQGYSDNEHADALFDNFAVYSSFEGNPDGVPVPEINVYCAPASAPSSPQWVGQCKKRFNLFAGKTSSDWKTTPVRFDADFGGAWDELDAAGRRAAIRSLRLVETDPVTGKPVVYDASLEGDQKYFQPFRVAPELYWQSAGAVSWSRAGNRDACYSLYYDLAAPYAEPFPKLVPMTGDGDRVQLGMKGSLHRLSLGISGSFEPFDADGDGDLDLLANIGTSLQFRSRDMLYGLYYYENLGGFFSPAQLFYAGSTPHKGLVNGNTFISIADINGDGNQDVIYSGFKVHEWWEFEMRSGRPVITAMHRLPVSGELPDKELKARVYDFNGNGLLDLQLGPTVFPNIGTSTEPLFDAKNPVELQMEGALIFDKQFYKDEEDGARAREWFFFPIDWDADGKRDLISSSNFPELFFRKNIGTQAEPKYGPRQRLKTFDQLDLEIGSMLSRVKLADWDGDGDIDLLFGGEEGFIGLCENIAGSGKTPQLMQSVFLEQLNAPMDGGSLVIPVCVDWDDDGDNDLVVGCSGYEILLFENEGSNLKPIWSAGHPIYAGGTAIQLMPGPDGCVQGPQENYWGYGQPVVVDWDGDGLNDLIVTGNRMTHHFFKNIGHHGHPHLAAGNLIQLKNPPRGEDGKRTDLPWGIRYEPQGNELITVHRTRPEALDWDGDGIMDYITMDHTNKLALYRGEKTESGEIVLNGPENIFTVVDPYARAMVWNHAQESDGGNWRPGSQGRSVVNIVDWDDDGDRDFIWDNINGRYFENTADDNAPVFTDRGDLVKARLANHNTGPEAVDFDGDGHLDLICGTESGRIYYFHRSFIERDTPPVAVISEQ